MSPRRSAVAAILAGTVIAAPALAQSSGEDRGGHFLYRLHNADGSVTPLAPRGTAPSVARQWKEVLLTAIRNDLARPTVHARNLYHTSAAMWDAWAAYDDADGEYF